MITIKETLSPQQDERTAALADEIWNECYASLLSTAQIRYMVDRFQSAAAIGASRREGARVFWLALDDEPVGYFIVKSGEKPGKLFLSKLYLRRAQRGKGFARLVMDRVKELARETGCTAVWLTVNKRNPAVAVYKKMGFSIVDSVVTDIGEGYVMDDYIMEAAV